MFIAELLIGMGIGAVAGGGARVFIKEGGVWNPMKNLGTNILDTIDQEAERRGSSITFDESDLGNSYDLYKDI
jgi:hypothetical protein